MLKVFYFHIWSIFFMDDLLEQHHWIEGKDSPKSTMNFKE
jgi:hypothetical protein